MLILRLSALLISISWLFLFPVSARVNTWAWVMLLLAALLLACLFSIHNQARERSRDARAVRGVLNGLAVVCAVWLAQLLLLSLYYKAGSVYHSAEPLAPIVSEFLKRAGFDTTWERNIVTVQELSYVLRFSVTFEKLAAFPLICFVLAEAMLLLILNAPGMLRTVILTASCAAAYALLRLVLLFAVYTSVRDLSLFWDPVMVLLSLLPLPLLIQRIAPVQLPQRTWALGRSRHWKATSWAAALVLTAGAALAIYLGYREAGIRKVGRVLIDEAHSNWEWTTHPFDKDRFGQQSLYNYYLAKEFAGYYFDVRVNLDRPIAAEALKECDVLVVKTPTRAFSDAETRAIEEFVSNGGGLFLIGDHTNLFGMSLILNEIAKPFAIQFNFDDTFDLASGMPSAYSRGRLLYHPIERNLEDFGFETSCTLDVPLSSELVVVGYGLGREWIDYGHKNFFGNMRLDPEDDYGLFVQAAAVKHGRGRVVAFSDSTVFSNFSFFWPGKAELFINALDYLNRQNRHGDRINLFALLVAVVCIAASTVIVYVRRLGKLVPLYAMMGAVGFLGAAAIAQGSTSRGYPKMRPHTQYATVAFDTEYSDIGLVEKSALLSDQEEAAANNLNGRDPAGTHPAQNTFRTFYVNLARLGVVPRAFRTFREALDGGGIAVLINPNKPFTLEDLHQLRHFLQNGGKLLLMDSVTNDLDSTNQLLSVFKATIRLLPREIDVSLKIPETRKATRRSDGLQSQEALEGTKLDPIEQVVGYQSRLYGTFRSPQLSIAGAGQPLISDAADRVLAHKIPYGRGYIIVFVDSAHFSNAFMGAVYKKPDLRESQVYKDMFFLFEQYLLDRSKERGALLTAASSDSQSAGR